MWLLIDDVRDANCDIVCRTYDAGVTVLMNMHGFFECVVFDHDLGEGEVNKTGYDLVQFSIANDLLPNRVQLITSNPVGRANMAAALKTAGYKTINGQDFKKD